MKRIFWIGVGVGLTVYLMTKAKRVLHKATPSGIAEQVQDKASGLLDSCQEFIADVRDNMNTRREELDIALGSANTRDIIEKTDN